MNIAARFPTFSRAFNKVASVCGALGRRVFPRRRLKRIGVALAILLALYTLVGFLVLPAILKGVIASQASKAL